jgi:hypothetical protein
VIYLTLEIAADTFPSGETLVKLLPFVLAAVFVVVATILTIAVANSRGAAASGLHSAELMRLYERNRRMDVNGLGCLTLPDFDLSCTLARRTVGP